MSTKKSTSARSSSPEVPAALQLSLESAQESSSDETMESVATEQTTGGNGQEETSTKTKSASKRKAPRKGEKSSDTSPSQSEQEIEQGRILEAQEFWELWLPYELEIVQAVSGFYLPIEGSDATRRQTVRRALLSRLWIEVQNGDEQARNTLEALSAVMGQFIHEVRDIEMRGEFEGQEEQSPQAPGALALRRLIERPDFLQGATAYASLFQGWLLDLATHNQLEGLAEPEAPIVEPEGTVALRPRPQTQSRIPNLPSPASLTLMAQGPNFQGDRDLHLGLALKDQPDAWLTNEHEGTRYFQGKSCIVTYRPDELFPESWYETREAALRQLDRRFREMRNDLAADMLDILFHHWSANPNHYAGNKAAITLSQTCEYRGIKPEQKSLQSHWFAIRDARSLRLSGDGVDAAVLELDAALIPQLSLWGREDAPRADMVYIYSPGFFISQALRDNPIYVAPYVRKIWSLDPYRETTAKRLARYLRGEWRLNTQAYLRAKGVGATRWRTWRNILSDAGISIQEHLVGKNPHRLRQDVQSALETLYGIEIIRDCTSTIYHPEDQPLLASLPRRGGTLAWLNLRVCIDPAADTTDALANTNLKRIARIASSLQATPENSAPSKKGQRGNNNGGK